MLTFSNVQPDRFTSSNTEPDRSLLLTARRCFCSSIFIALLRRHAHRLRVRVRRILVDAPLDLGPEVAQQALHGPGGAVAERADGVALDLLGHLEQHVDLALVRAPFRHAGEHAPHPAHALAARRALTAALVLVEVRD